ncbi:Por secretion system C-terminal sorting domain-containing protein [Chryseobacterium sp. RU37D]|uniref:T9SS type A sorting domain-containing protein n=1 Tax=Chryseobacterium sp. RU37D TaxID=1907397 RepID=UPI000954DDCB|nr:T9SS type A sorting domain-containing protein [Chryseobacterium sp. RU37D]SIQ02166.1 Por secretion system C-terminal sorting domain-containing protein [Chryseobacterium sp. RU37D]
MRKNFTSKLLALMALPSFFMLNAQCNPVNVPYLEDFNSTTDGTIPACTTKEWTVGSGEYFVHDYTGQIPGITSSGLLGAQTQDLSSGWFYTKGINMQGGTTYTLSFKRGANENQSLKVAYGTSAADASMVNLINDTPVFNTMATLVPVTYTFTPASTGVYYLGFNLYTPNSSGAILLDDISVTTATLATAETSASRDMAIYPNPATDYITVQSKQKIAGAEIFDVSGRKVLLSDKADRINVSSLLKGTYILNVKNADGTSSTHKFIKK